MLNSSVGSAIVTDPRGVFQGVVEIEVLTGAIARMRQEAKAHYEEISRTQAGTAGATADRTDPAA